MAADDARTGHIPDSVVAPGAGKVDADRATIEEVDGRLDEFLAGMVDRYVTVDLAAHAIEGQALALVGVEDIGDHTAIVAGAADAPVGIKYLLVCAQHHTGGRVVRISASP